jgi:ACR3 family arsenite transporter
MEGYIMEKEEIKVEDKTKNIGFFEKYLTVWVGICIAAGVIIGRLWPAVPNTLSQWEYAQVSIPVAVLIWFMIYPMMVEIDFSSIKEATKRPKGLTITLVTNWIIKPFTMFFSPGYF